MSAGGYRVVKDNRAAVKAKVHAAAVAALDDVAHELLRVANEDVPKEEGILEASGDVHPTPGKLETAVGYGGAAKDYVIPQHERMDYDHKGKGKAKWLEDTFKSYAGRVGAMIADAMRARLG